MNELENSMVIGPYTDENIRECESCYESQVCEYVWSGWYCLDCAHDVKSDLG